MRALAVTFLPAHYLLTTAFDATQFELLVV